MDRYAYAYDRTKIIPSVYVHNPEHTKSPSSSIESVAGNSGFYIITQIFSIFANKFPYGN